MILLIADKETEAVWTGERSRKLPGDIQDRALSKLRMIDAARSLDDLKVPPSNRLEEFSGKRKGGRVEDQDKRSVAHLFYMG